jgi:flagellar biogenesis protein FliO
VSDLVPWLVGLALVALGLLAWRNRRATAAGGEAIRLVAHRYLGGKRFLTLVEVDGERLLLGLGGDQIALVARLGEHPTAAEDADDAPQAPSVIVRPVPERFVVGGA